MQSPANGVDTIVHINAGLKISCICGLGDDIHATTEGIV